MNPESRKSVHSSKSWLFTPGTQVDHFEKATEVRADALIIDLEDAVASSAKQEARGAELHYLEALGSDRSLPCAALDLSGKSSKNAFHLHPLAGVSRMDRRLLYVQYLAHDDHQNFNFLFRLR
jgi:hypothetical protein